MDDEHKNQILDSAARKRDAVTPERVSVESPLGDTHLHAEPIPLGDALRKHDELLATLPDTSLKAQLRQSFAEICKLHGITQSNF